MSSPDDKTNAARTRILEAALAVFAESGFTGGTTREIARRAGVHQPVIHYYFKDKNDLWKEAVDAIFLEFSTALDAKLPSEADPVLAYPALVKVFVEFVADRPEWFTFMIHEGLLDGDRTSWLVERWVRPATLKLLAALGESVSLDESDAATERAMSIVAILVGSTTIFAQRVIIQKLTGLDVTDDTFIAQHISSVNQALESLLAARSISAVV